MSKHGKMIKFMLTFSRRQQIHANENVPKKTQIPIFILCIGKTSSSCYGEACPITTQGSVCLLGGGQKVFLAPYIQFEQTASQRFQIETNRQVNTRETQQQRRNPAGRLCYHQDQQVGEHAQTLNGEALDVRRAVCLHAFTGQLPPPLRVEETDRKRATHPSAVVSCTARRAPKRSESTNAETS